MSSNNRLPIGMGQSAAPPQQMPSPEQMEKVLETMNKMKGEQQKANHVPILKALENIGIPLRTEVINGTAHIVFPLNELIDKEYAYITGVDLETVFKQVDADQRAE